MTSTTTSPKKFSKYPRLAAVGGFELLKAKTGGHSSQVLPLDIKRYDISLLRARYVCGNGILYIRPLQKDLDLMPLTADERRLLQQEEDDDPKIKCLECLSMIPLHRFQQHKITCRSILDIFETNEVIGVDDIVKKDADTPFELLEDYPPSSSASLDFYMLLGDDLMEESKSKEEETQVRDVSPTPDVSPTQDKASLQGEPPTQGELRLRRLNYLQQQQPSIEIQDIPDPTEENPPIILPEASNDIIEKVIQLIRERQCDQNPVEIVKTLQKELMKGRALDIEDFSDVDDGDVIDIDVCRSDIIQTAFDELREVKDKFVTLKVQFYGENAQDCGGPRREFFSLILRAIKEKYFDHGLRIALKEDYFMVGIIFGMSILQNGNVPTFMENSILEEIFSEDTKNEVVCRLREGLYEMGIIQVGRQFPLLLHIFRPSMNSILTVKKLRNLLSPKFSEEGTNSRMKEEQVYAMFTKYTREVASGRRGSVTLGMILRFTTGDEEEPLLGYKIKPCIEFVEENNGYMPTSSTCGNKIYLPRSGNDGTLPLQDDLFLIYDLAFVNTYFGLV